MLQNTVPSCSARTHCVSSGNFERLPRLPRRRLLLLAVLHEHTAKRTLIVSSAPCEVATRASALTQGARAFASPASDALSTRQSCFARRPPRYTVPVAMTHMTPLDRSHAGISGAHAETSTRREFAPFSGPHISEQEAGKEARRDGAVRGKEAPTEVRAVLQLRQERRAGLLRYHYQRNSRHGAGVELRIAVHRNDTLCRCREDRDVRLLVGTFYHTVAWGETSLAVIRNWTQDMEMRTIIDVVDDDRQVPTRSLDVAGLDGPSAVAPLNDDSFPVIPGLRRKTNAKAGAECSLAM